MYLDQVKFITLGDINDGVYLPGSRFKMNWQPFIYSFNNSRAQFGPVMHLDEGKVGHHQASFDHFCDFWVYFLCSILGFYRVRILENPRN